MDFPDWPGRLTRAEAIKILDDATDKDDPFWERAVEAHYDERTETIPTIFDVFHALGVTEQEYRDTLPSGANIKWPATLSKDDA